MMATLTIRQLEDDVYQGLKARAESSGHSMETEVRAILSSEIRGRAWWNEWVQTTKPFRGSELPIPRRSEARKTNLS